MLETIVFIQFIMIVILFSKINEIKKQLFYLKINIKELSSIKNTKDKQPSKSSDKTLKLKEQKEVLSKVAITAKEDATKPYMIQPIKKEGYLSSCNKPIVKQKKSFDTVKTIDSNFLNSLLSLDNILVKIGAIVLFFGLAFLAKIAIENGFIGIKTRFIALAIVGIAIGVVGYMVRNKNRVYSMIMQGLSIAILYLTIYSAAKFYNLISLNSAFILMLIVVIIGSVLALLQDSLELAIFSITGGFLAPILTSSGDGNYRLLFGYYTLLNIGIFIISYKKAWRILNLVGFAFTFAIGTAWGVLRYTPDKYIVSESFLIFNFLLYLIISISFVKNQKFNPKGVIDTTLTFGLPAIFFSLQHFLVRDFINGDTVSAIILSLLYFRLWLNFKDKNKLLAKSYLIIGMIFSTMAIAYYFSKNVTSILWAFEGSLVIWLSIRQDSKISRYFGEIILLLSVGTYIFNNFFYYTDSIRYFGYIAISVAQIFASMNLKNIKLEYDMYLDKIFLSLGAMISIIATNSFLSGSFLSNYPCPIISILITSIVLYELFRRSKWEFIENILHLYIPLGLGILVSLIFTSQGHYKVSWSDVSIWMTYIVFGYFLLIKLNWRIKDKMHILNFIFMDLLLTYALYKNTNLPYKLSFILPSLLFAILLSTNALKHSISRFEHIYKVNINSILLVILALWQLMANHYMPSYSFGVPLLNILELIQIVILLLIAHYAFKSSNLPINYIQIAKNTFFILSFIFITTLYARAISHYADFSYDIGLIKNATFQTGLSIIWSILGMALILLSKKYTSRTLWIVGMVLLLVVVAKLFFIDLSNSATIQRVISFIAVGVLMLIIGYFVPIPPNKKEI